MDILMTDRSTHTSILIPTLMSTSIPMTRTVTRITTILTNMITSTTTITHMPMSMRLPKTKIR